MGKQSKTIRNKRKIKVENYENDYIDGKNINKKVTKAVTREAQFTIVSIFFVTIIMISTAYAIFSSVQKQETYNTLTVGTLKIDFDKSSSDMGNIINLNGAYPTSDEEGQKTSPYSFKITNSGTLDAYYKIKIVDDTDMINEDGCQDNLLPKDKIKVSINGGEPFLLNSTEANNYIVNDGNLDASESRTFSIRIWIDETAGNDVLGKHYHGKIVIEGENTTSTNNVICKRATTLHTEICSQTSNYCASDGYASGDTITYGSLGTNGTLSTGDAFDCDVNGDGTYDEAKERFYYVSDMTNGITTDDNTAILIYYNNVSGGEPSNSAAYAYNTKYSSTEYYGPQTALVQLPTTTQWSNVTLISTIRDITDEAGTIRVTEFSYEGYAARLLTYQEVNAGCYDGVTDIKSSGGLSSKCKFLMENTKYFSSTLTTLGGWLESSPLREANYACYVHSGNRRVGNYVGVNNMNYGVRPVIEVPKSRIDF